MEEQSFLPMDQQHWGKVYQEMQFSENFPHCSPRLRSFIDLVWFGILTLSYKGNVPDEIYDGAILFMNARYSGVMSGQPPGVDI